VYLVNSEGVLNSDRQALMTGAAILIIIKGNFSISKDKCYLCSPKNFYGKTGTH
jgi:hypothetical protein